MRPRLFRRILILVTAFAQVAVSTAHGQARTSVYDPQTNPYSPVAQGGYPGQPFDGTGIQGYGPAPNLAAPADPRFFNYRSNVMPQPGYAVPGQGAPGAPVIADDATDYSSLARAPDPVAEFLDKYLCMGYQAVYVPGYYDPFSSQFAYGATGYTPFQLGWFSKQELAYVPSAPTQGVNGQFESIEYTGTSRYSFQVDSLTLFSWTLGSGTRFLEGPSGVALGPRVTRLQSDFQLASTDPGPWNWQVGLTPQVNSDFERQLTRDAYMLDVRAVVFNRVAQDLTLALGIAYWDRNHGHLIPYGGIIWAPDHRWEFRAMFPKSRISYYAGSINQADVWLYGSAEYTIDAYQVTLRDNSRIKQRMELQDYRFMLGVTVMQPRFGAYFEGGYITDRHANFRGPTHDFGIGDAWTIRMGVTF